jgi:hypothetical protein
MVTKRRKLWSNLSLSHQDNPQAEKSVMVFLPLAEKYILPLTQENAVDLDSDSVCTVL